ncbi:MAG: hypothetical protein ACREJC_10935 [Tepidisphaeraceae bacterium]
MALLCDPDTNLGDAELTDVYELRLWKRRAMKIMFLSVVLTLSSLNAAAQNPCTAALPTGVVLNPTILHAQLLEQTATLADGSPAVTEYQLGYFAAGVDPQAGGAPQSTLTYPKASWTLVAGTPDCYQGTPLGVAGVPIGGQFKGALKARRIAGGTTDESAWSVPSNFFGRTAAPLTPGRPIVR